VIAVTSCGRTRDQITQFYCKNKFTGYAFFMPLHLVSIISSDQVRAVSASRCHKGLCAREGFTLVELLVVIVILAALMALGIAGMRSAVTASKQAASSTNLRNIGVALQLYADDNQGKYPQTTHTTGIGSAWIYTLERYLGNFDQARICPADPRGKERLAAKGSSYILNSYVFVPRMGAFGKVIGPQLNRPAAIPHPERTKLVFICSDRTAAGSGNDHTHSNLWTSWSSLLADIAPDRFGGNGKDRSKGRSLYLNADTSVETLTARDVKQKTESGINIAKPPGVEGLE
jgi:prepilin-type N-terminal cleavage/methylation domain-containing protein